MPTGTNTRPNSPDPGARDGFGCAFSQLYQDQALNGGNISFFRKGTGDRQLEQVATPASDRGYLIGISSGDGHRRRIFHEHHATSHDFGVNSVYIRNLAESYCADLGGPFDFLLLEISPSSLARIAQEADLPDIRTLSCDTASKDPILGHLTRALLPALERPGEASTLFVDQMATAIGTYLVQTYGGVPHQTPSRPQSLTHAQENRAKALLLDHLDGDISMSTVAGACNLSRGYFIRAFRETTGQTPYQWLIGERIRRARDMLASLRTPIADVARACGFADQSHFTRVFSSVVGETPATWRRSARM